MFVAIIMSKSTSLNGWDGSQRSGSHLVQVKTGAQPSFEGSGKYGLE